jgi:hypothetical protein
MRRLSLLALLAACAPEPLTASDCLPTYGDNCSCTEQCLTQEQIDDIDDFCDLGCDSEATWECGVDANAEACVVLE